LNKHANACNGNVALARAARKTKRKGRKRARDRGALGEAQPLGEGAL
jgi:hypothetical protein